MRKQTIVTGSGGLAAILATILFVPGQMAIGADHVDPPSRTDPTVDPTPDIAADMADLFVWREGSNIIIAYTFGGPSARSLPGFYDRDVVYGINISTAAPATTVEVPITFRFGPGTRANEHGVRVEGLPGVSGPLIGTVERILSKDGVRVFAGVRDDPFFFDSQGLRETRATASVRFSNQRDNFAMRNDTAVVLEIPMSRLGNGNSIDVWTTSSRFGGNI